MLSAIIKMLILLSQTSGRNAWYPRIYFAGLAEANAFYSSYLNTRAWEEREHESAHYSILQDDTKRERYLSSSSLPRSFYSGIRSNKHSAEADSRGKILEGSSDVRGQREREHILNQLDCEAENRLADSHRRFPSSSPLIPDRYESTFRLHRFLESKLRGKRLVTSRYRKRIYSSSTRCRQVRGKHSSWFEKQVWVPRVISDHPFGKPKKQPDPGWSRLICRFRRDVRNPSCRNYHRWINERNWRNIYRARISFLYEFYNFV